MGPDTVLARRSFITVSMLALVIASSAIAAPAVKPVPTLNSIDYVDFASTNTLSNPGHQTLMDILNRYTSRIPYIDKSSVVVSSVNTNHTAGGDLGLQVGKFLGLEGGGYYFQTGSINGGQPAITPQDMADNQQVKYKSWVGYLAMKAKAPIMRMLDVYAKVGAGYEHQNSGLFASASSSSSTTNSNGEFHSWVPVFSVGLEDHLTKSLNLNLQYMHLADSWQLHDNDNQNNNTNNKFAHKNIVTMSLAYLFKL